MPNQLDGKPIGRVFGTPLTIKGWEVLPLAELFYFGLLYWLLGRGHPGRSRKEKAGLAALATPLVAGVEWCHNLSHAAAARAVGKPMDEFKILFGTPRLQYWELNDASVTPRQHILRASGGPLFNLAMTPVLWLLRRQAPQGSKQRQVINAGWWMNLLVLAAGILPIPGLDGGALLKWELVRRGRSVHQADETVRRVNGGLSVALGAGALLAKARGQGLLAVPLALLAGIALAVFRGWIREK